MDAKEKQRRSKLHKLNPTRREPVGVLEVNKERPFRGDLEVVQAPSGDAPDEDEEKP